jgi:hypothetical protein
MRVHHLLWAVASAVSAATGQLLHTIPNGLATVEGNSSNLFPWGSGGTPPGLRMQSVYDSSNFTAGGVTAPVAVTRLRWRANASSATWAGGTYAIATVRMCTATADHAAISTTFAANLGPDLTTVATGPVTFQAGTGAGVGSIGPVVVDLSLQTPFLYDPNAGDLLIDIDFPSTSYAGGNLTSLDVQTTGSMSSRLYASATYGAPTGIFEAAHGVVVELTCLPANGFASFRRHGNGCYDGAMSFYEAFAGVNFDLGGSATATTSILCTPNGNGGYAVTSGSGAFQAPTSPDLLLGDDSLSAVQNLGFTFVWPGGSSASVRLCSNGFLWLDPVQTAATAIPSSQDLLGLGARIAPYWVDLDPTLQSGGNRLGSVHFERDGAGNAVCTWLDVPEAGAAANLSTVQVVLRSNGGFEMRYGRCTLGAASALLVGASRGGGARDPGGRDLSASLPFETRADSVALSLSASARPILGTTVQLLTNNIPAGTIFGAVLFSASRVIPANQLGSIGMPGCYQHVGLDIVVPFYPPSSAHLLPLSLPSDPTFAGSLVQNQAAMLVPGANPLGAVSSNGLELRLDWN